MNVLFRADASERIGGGHIGRCIALAEELKDRGVQVQFVTRGSNELGPSMLERAGIAFHILACNEDWRSDAAATQKIAGSADWIVVDHYGLDGRWQAELKQTGRQVLVIDDLADRQHCCDILVDTGRPVGDTAYERLVPDDCIVMQGPRFLMLRQEFSDRKQSVSSSGRKKVLVFFGAADGAALTLPTLDALDRSSHRSLLDVHVIVTEANAQREEIRKREGVVVHEDVTNMASLMAELDFAIGAGGVSMWERCCMGLPSLTIAVNDNQKPGVKVAADAGAVISLELATTRETDKYCKEISRFVVQCDDPGAISDAARQLVDGRGAARIAGIMGPAQLRNATGDDCKLIWEWASDPAVRRMAFQPDPIPFDSHIGWYMSRLESDTTLIQIAEIDGRPAGQVRLDHDDQEAGWVVDISVAAAYRGRGHAVGFLLKAIARFRRKHPGATVVAWVKFDNEPSIRLFEAAGFFRSEATTDAIRFVDSVT